MRLPIGIFDSGLGGLSVVARVMELLPNERIIYLADNAHVPYGERPLEQIAEFAVAITDFLIENGAKAVVMACNMSSAAALEAARTRYPDTPILGVIEPGVKSALSVSNGAPVGVLATTGTVKSEAYARTAAKLDPNARVFQQACPRFVPIVEAGESSSEEAEAAACTYVGPLAARGCKTLVLGCTHYPFLRKAIQSAAGPEIVVVDPAEETALALKKILVERDMASDRMDAPHTFCVTGETDSFGSLGSAFLRNKIDTVQKITWGFDLGRKLRAPVRSRDLKAGG